MRLDKACGSVAALMRNLLTFWLSLPSKRPFRLYFRQTSPARLFSQCVMIEYIHPMCIRGRRR